MYDKKVHRGGLSYCVDCRFVRTKMHALGMFHTDEPVFKSRRMLAFTAQVCTNVHAFARPRRPHPVDIKQ